MNWLFFSTILYKIDDILKRKAEGKLEVGGEPVDCLNGKVRLERIRNKGIAGGKFSDREEGVRNLTTLAFGGIILRFLAELPKKGHTAKKLGLAMTAGGAAGNLADRWKRGSVTDFISVRVGGLRKIVFNPADVFIGIGGLIAALDTFFSKNKDS